MGKAQRQCILDKQETTNAQERGLRSLPLRPGFRNILRYEVPGDGVKFGPGNPEQAEL